MDFEQLVAKLEQLESQSSRLDMMRMIADILTQVTEDEMRQVVYLMLSSLRPKYDRLEFGMAERMVERAIARASKTELIEVEERAKELGDLGLVAAEFEGERNSKKTIGEVYFALEQIASAQGIGSQAVKVDKLAELLKSSSAVAAKYIVRMVIGKLRLGFSDKTLIDALSYIATGSKSASQEIEKAYQLKPDLAEIAYLIKKGGVALASAQAKVTLGVPVVPALAQRIVSADLMIAKMGKVIVEPKYDGTRVQIHFSRKKREIKKSEANGSLFDSIVQENPPIWVKTFTRNLDESTTMFPELEKVAQQINAEEVILDAEAVGYDPKTGKLLPFQQTITRKRKHNIAEISSSVPLKFFVFDILYLDSKNLLHLPLYERKQILQKVIMETEAPNAILKVEQVLQTENATELRDYHKTQIEKGLEGALVKKIDGEYLPGRQNFNWVKFKEEEGQAGKLSDTIDAIIMGYYLGRGKRQKFGIGAFLVGVVDEEKNKIVTIAKIGTGVSDIQFGELFERLQSLKADEKPSRYEVSKLLIPNVWVKPEIVVEVAADEITQSPSHTSQYALRFPRLERFRDDKRIENATSKVELMEIAGYSTELV